MTYHARSRTRHLIQECNSIFTRSVELHLAVAGTRCNETGATLFTTQPASDFRFASQSLAVLTNLAIYNLKGLHLSLTRDIGSR